MNEVSPQSLQGLALGLEALAPVVRDKIQVIAGSAGTMASAALDADVVIADPPRKGLDRELLEHLVAAPPERFVYVSCGLDSFLADTARLTTSGAMRLSDLRVFNLMPYTEHVETVACFERA
jgi:tRNA/tmRNA/rRNA uracil-C5-methylase (TrmA/RlmC/RlmD family)